jgi:hypothetical protein
MKLLTFTINEDATITGDAQGFQGCGCTELLEKMLNALGDKISGGHKPEYHQNVVTPIKAGR